MYIPIVFGVNVYGNIPPFLEFFYKFAEQSEKNNWPIIAQEEYFYEPKYYEKNYNLTIENSLKYHNVKSINLNKLDKYIIPKEITEAIIKKTGNIDNAWIKLMNSRFYELEKYLLEIITKIKNNSKKDLKALLVWRHNESISFVAKKLGIKLIEMEFTSFRYPVYNELISYFTFSNKYQTKEFEERYKKFKKENNNIPVLTRKEILCLFLNNDYLDYINRFDDNELYDYGVALGLDKDYESKSTNSYLNKEIIDFCKKLNSNNNIIYRKHPSSTYTFTKTDIIDNSINSTEFILKCKRIVSCLSNISFEAMLYGKTSYIMGNMPYKKFGVCKNYITEEIISLEKLNYILFAFYAPYDLMLEADYLNWRLTNPTEKSIYMKHLNYYLKKRNLNLKSIFNKTGIERLKYFLKNATNEKYTHFINNGKQKLQKEMEKTEKELLLTKENAKELEGQILLQQEEFKEIENRLINIIAEKDKIITEQKNLINQKDSMIINQQNHINKIYNSKSWKITKPLRIIKKVVKNNK